MRKNTAVPHSNNSERCILATLLQQNQAWEKAKVLTEDDFYLDSHQRIFACIRSRLSIGRPIDLVLAMDAMKRQKELDKVGGLHYLASLDDLLPRNFDIGAHVAVLQEKAQLRRLMAIFYNALLDTENEAPAAQVMASVKEKLSEIESSI